MKYFVGVSCQNPDCENDQVEVVCPAYDEDSADGTANLCNLHSLDFCKHCGEKLLFFGADESWIKDRT